MISFVSNIQSIALIHIHPFPHLHISAVLYVIYWRDIKLSAVVLGVCLMTLLTLSLNTFIHTLVLIQLSFLVVTLTYIVTKIAIDSFYNRDIANPFKLVVTINAGVLYPSRMTLPLIYIHVHVRYRYTCRWKNSRIYSLAVP